jgi:hypothetical protein
LNKICYAKTSVVLLLALISSSLLSQTVLSREALGLKGPVKVHTIIGSEGDREHYYFDRNGRLTRYWFEGHPYYNNSQSPLDFVYKYDEQNRIIRVNKTDSRSHVSPYILISYHSEGWLLSIIEYNLIINSYETTAYTKTQYDSLGRKTIIEVYNEDESITSKESFSYDANGRLVSYSIISDDSYYSSVSTTYFYDSSGRLIRSETENSDAIISTTYHYNEKGLLIQESESTEGNQSGESIKSYKYDNSDLLTEIVITSDGEDWVCKSYTYDNYGNVLSEYNDPSERYHSYEYYR